jgi:hypothetical protein
MKSARENSSLFRAKLAVERLSPVGEFRPEIAVKVFSGLAVALPGFLRSLLDNFADFRNGAIPSNSGSAFHQLQILGRGTAPSRFKFTERAP